MGRLIPAGTGFEYYRHVRIPPDEPPPPPAPVQPTDDELELERDMEYFVEPDEALAPRTGDLGEAMSSIWQSEGCCRLRYSEQDVTLNAMVVSIRLQRMIWCLALVPATTLA